MKARKKHFLHFFLYFVLFLGSAMVLFPVIWMLLSAFKTNTEIITYPPTFFPKNPTLINIINIWDRVHFEVYFFNSIFVAVAKTTIVLYTSALAGYVFAKLLFKGRDIIFLIVLATLMIPWPVTIIPLYQQMVWFRWVDSFRSLIIPHMMNSFGIFMMRQFVTTIPTEMIEAARVDGAGEFVIFHRIIIRMLGSALSALAIFIFLWTWDDFLWPFLMLSSKTKLTLPVGLALFSGQYWTDYSGVLAGAALTILPVVVFYIIFQRRFIEGISLTGMKA